MCNLGFDVSGYRQLTLFVLGTIRPAGHVKDVKSIIGLLLPMTNTLRVV
jgi:hypothetical protein